MLHFLVCPDEQHVREMEMILTDDTEDVFVASQERRPPGRRWKDCGVEGPA
jgi:hypothetical protein